MARGGKREGAGRPAGARDKATIEQKGTIEELARSHAPTALDALASIASAGQSEGARVSAATALLDRAYGKPRQAVEHTGKDGGPIQTEDISDTDAARRVAFMLRRGAQGEGRKDH